jgi:regulator of sigma E protease
MSVFLFIIILVVLIVGHEFGHFVSAKLAGMRVLEFGIGFPPKIWGAQAGDTEYSVNALPFGGFVKIFGEDEKEKLPDPKAFSNRPRLAQAAVIAAGPLANVLIAFLLSSAAFMIGVPTVLDDSADLSRVSNARVIIAEVIPGSPAAIAGIRQGDVITSIEANGIENAVLTASQVVALISSAEEPVTLSMVRSSASLKVTVTPLSGIVKDEPERKAIGIASALVGTISLPPLEAVVRGFSETFRNAVAVIAGLYHLFASSFTLTANLSGIAGPVGIASLVGEAAVFGFGSLLMFAAMISVNLAVVNALPFPALDGGRLALLGIESLSRKRIPLQVVSAINLVGFAVLIALMLAVTVHDIAKIVL